MDTFEKLDEMFECAPEPAETKALVPVEVAPSIAPAEIPDPIQHDQERARDTIHELIDKGLEAVDEMMNVAKQSNHPRAFEVTGQLIKTVAELSKDLLAVQKQAKELREGPAKSGKPQDTGPTTNNTTNVIFAGTTRELMEAMRQTRAQIPATATVLPK